MDFSCEPELPHHPHPLLLSGYSPVLHSRMRVIAISCVFWSKRNAGASPPGEALPSFAPRVLLRVVRVAILVLRGTFFPSSPLPRPEVCLFEHRPSIVEANSFSADDSQQLFSFWSVFLFSENESALFCSSRLRKMLVLCASLRCRSPQPRTSPLYSEVPFFPLPPTPSIPPLNSERREKQVLS